MLNVGDEAPDFELQNQDGEKVSLSDFENEYVVVYFYPRANTPGCTTEACEFRDASNEFEAHDATVLGISDDPISDLEEFADDHDLSFPLLSDEDGTVASAYDSYGEKNMFGNTFDGVFRNSYVVAPDGTIAFVYEGVSPEGHAEEILSDLKAHRESSD
ncbi:thioredoxin-dependent thiol peroxidase [Halogeometricum borinquense]|uniref:thioredoxin-dependent peroxiredoxin n=1 Tax=Halogeometricum borinquense TaxID=60847 RepID=A0A6C0UHG9_9EURY|nr:thioredoxin-dependent thiol peroxidase [Halogeometricum borinquense]QIB74932.1 thioredoxin-dependent thiol peroxidase [Halogeometricum borinquense]QIQ76068.1 thioredoxin-dependent thiol peroxidase [Halogeometricum borinquense]